MPMGINAPLRGPNLNNTCTEDSKYLVGYAAIGFDLGRIFF